ncbi:DUF5694 domain-containing protein [Halobacterium salinarum]|uniref:Uncharacterized protein n=2 Tax=Halobacterium salinarum TaxID=2242 RepID=B0RA31_HALS3|nr:DUF5694 domain-containing protein [Halobacterium salinarum]MBB6090891.1 hypothetical protein [Halobacterium salinarum]MDL0132114.1 DUF5694 domain-containing protein [Halobacterium salinarum]MDL0138815.1 DUF5694 domain-containing protein [Halobacterium salinarum]UEB93167.1 DUF5694 domain-containing protein [Halobacterium salinarum NRC-34001]CAP15631.1 uncharacterized protein OE_5318F [Halobacterium salinarum R1]
MSENNPPMHSDSMPAVWPDPEESQIEVLLLGTYHMDNPGLDEVNVTADDVLTATRQAELQELVDRLEPFAPDRIGLERPWDRDDALNDTYAKYRDGEYVYGEEYDYESVHSDRNEPGTECRSEVVQVGFRLADRLGHDRVFPIDEHPPDSGDDPFEDRDRDSAQKTGVPVPDSEEMQRRSDDQLAASTIPEYLAWRNQEVRLRQNHLLMFDRGVRATGEAFGSPLALSYWYDRNIRIVRHLWEAIEEGDDRAMIVVGSGHIRVLRHLLTEAPMFCPVSPLPYLE